MTESKNKERADNRIQLAAAVGRVVELKGIRLGSMNAQLFSAGAITTDSDVELVIGRRNSYVFNEEDSLIHIKAEFSLSCHVPTDEDTESSDEAGDTEPEEALHIDVAFDLDYILTVPPPPEEQLDSLFSAFADLNGSFNAWPYFREVVQNTVVRMGVPPFVMPLFRLPALAQPESTSEKEPSPPKPNAENAKKKARRKKKQD